MFVPVKFLNWSSLLIFYNKKHTGVNVLRNAGVHARVRRREVRANFCGASFRRLKGNAGKGGVSGQNAGELAPEKAEFFVVEVLAFIHVYVHIWKYKQTYAKATREKENKKERKKGIESGSKV